MVFNTDFALQVARDHQAALMRGSAPGLEPGGTGGVRHRIGTWIVRLGRAVEGPAPAQPNRAWQA